MRSIIILSIVFATASGGAPTGEEPVVGRPCEGCELVFAGMPAEFESEARIAPANAAGEALRIEGRVVDAAGDPVPGTIVYAYHTDADGIYPGRDGADDPGVGRHGTFRAWVAADEDGRFVFRTIRPASYPNSTVEQHVHMHVIEPGRCTYWIDAVVFDDDPLLRDHHHERQRGGNGLTSPRRDDDGAWVVHREVVLGKNVSGHPGGS